MGAVGFMPVLSSTKVGRGCRTSITGEIRKLLELKKKDALEWVFENERAYIRKAQGVIHAARHSYCGFEGGLGDFKQLREPCRFKLYNVWILKCPMCRSMFNYHEGTSPQVGTRFSRLK